MPTALGRSRRCQEEGSRRSDERPTHARLGPAPGWHPLQRGARITAPRGPAAPRTCFDAHVGGGAVGEQRAQAVERRLLCSGGKAGRGAGRGSKQRMQAWRAAAIDS